MFADVTGASKLIVVWMIVEAIFCPANGLLAEGDGSNMLTRRSRSFVPPSSLPEESSILKAPNMPSIKSHYPEVGNGHLATVVQSDTIYMNGLFNGFNTTSHRARIPSTVGYTITSTVPGGLNRTFSLDLGRGLFNESYIGNGVEILLRTYAHRLYTNVLVAELELSRHDVSIPVSVTLTLNSGNESIDIDLVSTNGSVSHYRTKEAEFEFLEPRSDFYVKTSPGFEDTITLPAGLSTQTFAVLTSIGVDQKRVSDQYFLALRSFQSGNLLSSHVTEWSKAWNRGRIDVAGDVKTANNIYASFYYLFASLPFNGNRKDWPFIGLSPGGLAHGPEKRDYYGHVFWDQDVWMYPGVAFFHSDLGQILVDTRTKTVNASKLYAAMGGWEGARYAWESAFTGMETCPAPEPALYQIHITGDVALMMKKQYQLTGSIDILTAEVVFELARYWASRVTYRPEDDTYRILGVMGPDEFHYPVNDSVYTNSIAVITFNFANQVANIIGYGYNQTWDVMAKKMHIPYDPVNDYHPEFEGYRLNTEVKQADVVLLDYPLMVDMKGSTRENNLRIYEEVIPDGTVPAMTWGIHLINWLRIGNETKAQEMLEKSTLNAQEPFLIWTENANGHGAVNFITGMGGYLQSLIFGYGGCRIFDDYLFIVPRVIPGTNNVRFVDIDYRGFSFDLEYNQNDMTISLVSINNIRDQLQLQLGDSYAWQTLTLGNPFTIQRLSFKVRAVSN